MAEHIRDEYFVTRDVVTYNGSALVSDKKNLVVEVSYNIVIEKLFKLTTLEDTFSCNFNVLIDGMPKVLGVKSIIEEWVRFRKDCLIRKFTFNIDKMQKRHHLLLGLKQILFDIDKAIDIIRNTEKENQVVPNLMRAFELTQMQAEFVAEIKLRHLNKQYILNTLQDVDKLEKEIAKYTEIINSDTKLKKVISDELCAAYWASVCCRSPHCRRSIFR